MTTLLSFIVVLGIIVFVHEAGHFIAAKLTGMRVEIFSLGFGHKLLSKKIGDTEYRIAWIPLGGYVKIAGMIDESLEGEEKITGKDDEFESKKNWQKAFVISAGVILNFALAIVIYTILAFNSGLPVPDSTYIGDLGKDMPAIKAGIIKNDKIIAVDNYFIKDWETLSDYIHERPNQDILVTILRDNKSFQTCIKTNTSKGLIDDKLTEVGVIGISPKVNYQPLSILEATSYGFKTTWSWTKMAVLSIKMLVVGEASVKDLGGPVMIAQMSGESAKAGLSTFFAFIAFISINIGFLNILPIPVLDGGHLLFISIESVIRRKINLNIKMKIQQFGMVALLLLMGIALFNDVGRLMPSQEKETVKENITK